MILPAEIVRQLTHDCREPKQARAEAQPGAFGRMTLMAKRIRPWSMYSSRMAPAL